MSSMESFDVVTHLTTIREVTTRVAADNAIISAPVTLPSFAGTCEVTHRYGTPPVCTRDTMAILIFCLSFFFTITVLIKVYFYLNEIRTENTLNFIEELESAPKEDWEHTLRVKRWALKGWGEYPKVQTEFLEFSTESPELSRREKWLAKKAEDRRIKVKKVSEELDEIDYIRGIREIPLEGWIGDRMFPNWLQSDCKTLKEEMYDTSGDSDSDLNSKEERVQRIFTRWMESSQRSKDKKRQDIEDKATCAEINTGFKPFRKGEIKRYKK